ncbi:cobalamin biosynthesis protein [Rhodococcus gannanensis]|uniref:Cobalamin biosynthesis protein n=1 Tax=Rhodococcus gannanensis TaxID=1960308 RepID=A0ABW4PB09_9NOCA
MADLVVGVGLRDGVGAAAVVTAVRSAIAEIDASPTDVVALATLDRKAAELAVVRAAAELGVPVLGFTAAELAAASVPNPSARVAAVVGTPSVAEAAAILGSGGGELVARKRARDGVTVALARTV